MANSDDILVVEQLKELINVQNEKIKILNGRMNLENGSNKRFTSEIKSLFRKFATSSWCNGAPQVMKAANPCIRILR